MMLYAFNLVKLVKTTVFTIAELGIQNLELIVIDRQNAEWLRFTSKL